MPGYLQFNVKSLQVPCPIVQLVGPSEATVDCRSLETSPPPKAMQYIILLQSSIALADRLARRWGDKSRPTCYGHALIFSMADLCRGSPLDGIKIGKNKNKKIKDLCTAQCQS